MHCLTHGKITMRMLPIISALFASITCATTQADPWKPAPTKLTTPWSKDVSPENALPGYPRPQLVRPAWTNLNGLWDYAMAEAKNPQPEKYQGQILVPFPVESGLSGVKKFLYPTNRLWYHRTFETPANLQDKRLLLHFGGVDWNTTVFVNGKELGNHKGGFDAFTFDITDALKPSGPQELIVAVIDKTGGDNEAKGKQVGMVDGEGTLAYSCSSGIWQTVWLEPVPKSFIADLKITPDVDAGKLSVTTNGAATLDTQRVEVIATSGGKEIAKATGKVGESLSLPIPNAHLWSPEDPFLYELKVTLKQDDKEIDAVTSYFAMRKISIAKDEKGIPRTMLNNKFVFHVGPLDQGYWPDGVYTAPTDAALRYDLEMTKKLGCNATRKHMKIEPDRWYYWADKLGLMVWQDMPGAHAEKSAEATKQFEGELKAMVESHYNHPCIVMWIPFNEGWGQYDTQRIANWIKELDPTRMINGASGGLPPEFGEVHDSHAYYEPTAQKSDGQRVEVNGEFGGRALLIPGHTVTQKIFGHPGGTILGSPWEATQQYCRLARVGWSERDKGLCGIIYTQLTDIEGECNGWITYDRAVVKVDVDRVAAANRGEPAPPKKFKVLSPTGDKTPVTWRHILEQPADGWEKPDFDDSAWKEAPSPFSQESTQHAIPHTRWTGTDIWLRHAFTLDDEKLHWPQLIMYHNERVEVYINGVLAASRSGLTINYEEFEMTPESQAALKPGRNVIAVHCVYKKGGAGIDVAVVDRLDGK